MTIQTDRRTVSDRGVNFNAVSPGFFATRGVRVLAGRDFDQLEWQRFTAFPDLDRGQMTRHSVTVLTSHSERLSIHSDV